MLVTVLYNLVSEDAARDDLDVLVQVEAVCEALGQLGHEPVRLGCSLDLEALRRRLLEDRPDVVFNLVESLGESDRLAVLATALLDVLGVSYTGSPTEALFLTNHKLLAKERLCQAGLPTPGWVTAGSAGPTGAATPEGFRPGDRYIIKTISEHASFGLDDAAVVAADDLGALGDRIRQQAERLGGPCFAERYVDGREFNLSVLEGPEGPEVLPPAEIDFSAFPPGKLRIVDYRAKWHEDSFEFANTPRCFDFAEAERPLVDRLCDLALRAWDAFGLRGYARVDFRADAEGRPWILEINANPCLSPDAGFAAALRRASIPFEQAVQRIVEAGRVCADVSHP